MRRLAIMLAAGCLLGIGSGPAALAQSPSSSSDAVPLRVALPGEGFAVTFPEGWVIDVTGGESYLLSPDRSARCLTTGEWFEEPIEDPAAFVDEAAAIFPVLSDDGPVPVIETTAIELPAGRAIRSIIDFALVPEFDASDSEGPRHHTHYILADDLRFLVFSCYSPERPDDDWLSIA